MSTDAQSPDLAATQRRLTQLEKSQRRWQRTAGLALLLASLATVDAVHGRMVPPDSIRLAEGARRTELSPGRLVLHGPDSSISLTATTDGGSQIVATAGEKGHFDVILASELSSLTLRHTDSAALSVTGGHGSLWYGTEEADGKGEYGLRVTGRPARGKNWSTFFGSTPEGVEYALRGVDRVQLSGQNGALSFDAATPALRLEGRNEHAGKSRSFALTDDNPTQPDGSR